MNKPITTEQLQLDTKNLWLILGGAPTNTPDVFESEDALIAVKVPESQTASVIKHIKWESGKVFYPWEPGLDPEANPYYCVNQNILYLCVGNTPKNRKDQSGDYLTSVPPTNTGSVAVTGSDGYSWLPLYFIDYTKEGFITDSDFPLPDFNVNVQGSNFTSIYSSVCSGGITQSGKCCLYYKTATTDKITGISYMAGDLVHASANSYCYECYDLAQKLDLYYKFSGGVGATAICDPSYEITSLLDTLQSISSTLPPNTTKQFQLNILKDYQSHYNGIFKADINLSGICIENRTVSSANPYLNIVDPHSDGNAKVRLITSQINDNSYEVVGISVEETGKNYIYPSFTITGETNTALVNAITLYTYPLDVFEIPESILKTKSFLVNSQVNVENIKNISYNSIFTKIALTNNLRSRTDETITEYAPESAQVKNLQTRFVAAVLDVDEETQVESLPPAIEGLGGATEITGPIDCVSENAEDCYTADNTSLENYNIYVSAIRTNKTLISGKNYGYIPHPVSGSIPGFQVETNDISDTTVSPVNVGDRIVILGNPCQILSVTKPDLGKNNQYFSPQKVNLNIDNLSDSVTLNFNIKVTTY